MKSKENLLDRALPSIKRNKLITLIFVLSTSFFLWQHSTGIGWDFSAYVLNAKYLFSQGHYFEWLRPPIAPLIIGIFSIFGWAASEYIFIIFVSVLYLFSSLKMAEKWNIDKKIFYSLTLCPFLLFMGLSAGTELLSLAFLQLFLAYMDKKKSGFFFGLAFLTRYQNFIFIPLLFFKKDFRKILLSVLVLILTISPWLAFNHIMTGNAFMSMADSYALNVKFRGYMVSDFNFNNLLNDLLLSINVLIPFVVFGIAVGIKMLTDKKTRANAIMMFLFLSLVLYSYQGIPFKTVRYLFNLLLPVFYFSTIAISRINRKLIYCIIPISMMLIFSGIQFYPKEVFLEDPKPYTNLIANLNQSCAIASNLWLPLNYLNVSAEPIIDPKIIHPLIGEGYKIILNRYESYPELLHKINYSDYPLIEDRGGFLIFGNSTLCREYQSLDRPYLQQMDRMYGLVYNKSFSITNYELLFTSKIP